MKKITGNMSRTAFQQCGVTTYNVMGTLLSNGVFSLDATFQSNQNSCDTSIYLVVTSIHEDVTLSGPSASQVAAQWTTTNSRGDRGTGSSSWRAVTQHYNVSYAAYIAVDHIMGPSACGIVPTNYILYKGDAFRGTYRTTQSIVAIPRASWSFGFYANTGPTRNYSVGSPVSGANLDSFPLTSDIYNGPYFGQDEDGIAGDCQLFNANSQASTNTLLSHSVSYPSPTQAVVQPSGAGINPLEIFRNDEIVWNMFVSIDDSNPTVPTASVNYTHTCYPGHIVKVNGTVVYSYQPTTNNSIYYAGCLTGVLPAVTGQSGPVVIPGQ
jgi:hypothetical protein